jgi:hypothetical protein
VEPEDVRVALRRAAASLRRLTVITRRKRVVAYPANGQLVYRGIGRGHAVERDFFSDRGKERPRAPDQDYMDYVGLSVFGSLEAAEANMVRYPKRIAHVRLEEGHGFMIARTYADIDEHYTIWGDPRDLMGLVETVSRSDEPE